MMKFFLKFFTIFSDHLLDIKASLLVKLPRLDSDVLWGNGVFFGKARGCRNSEIQILMLGGNKVCLEIRLVVVDVVELSVRSVGG
jgi:hypothetical protein